MMKKVLVSGLIGSTLVLSGCFGGGSSETSTESLSTENFATFDNKVVAMQYPVNWKLKTGDQIDSDMRDSLIAVMTSNFKDPFFTPVITIEQVAVSEGVGSVDFAESTIKSNSLRLIGYEELERKDITTYKGGVAVNTKLVRFRGKEKLDDQVLEFLQVFLTQDGIGYTVTGAYDPNDEDSEASKIVQSLNTFSLK